LYEDYCVQTSEEHLPNFGRSDRYGTPVEIVRKGTVLMIIPERASKLARLKKRTGFDGDPDEIIGMDWMRDWMSNDRLVF
jgi:hypothetical protein